MTDRLGWTQSTIERLAHFAPVGFLIVCAWAFSAGVFGGFVRSWPISGPVLLLLLMVIIATAVHPGLLCTRCASRTPLDGQAAAARYDHSLRWYHRSRVARLLPTGVVFAVLVATLVFGLPEATVRFGCVMLFMNLSFDLTTWNRHLMLVPWCPYCRRGQSGWEDHGPREPSPVPAPSDESRV